jgi:thiamine kinase
LQVLALPGGRGCNLVLRVDTTEGRFVLRQRQPPLDRPGSPARMEVRSHRLAARAGLAPRLIDAADDGHWLLMEYLDDAPWTDAKLNSATGVEQLGARLATLHALAPPADAQPFDAVAIARGYVAQLEQLRPDAMPQHRALLRRVEQLSAELEADGVPAVLNHGDLQRDNLLGTGPWLIDWEYAQVVAPTYDMACLLTYYPALELQLDRLLGSAGLGRPRDRAQLGLQRERFACLNRFWEQVDSTGAG